MSNSMDASPVCHTAPITCTNTRQNTANHTYGTRIRQNISIKPSVRLRQSHDNPPTHKKARPGPSSHPEPQPNLLAPLDSNDYPLFPPPHIVLHTDDANNKVFLAIGRAFLSVNNRAMTIKDLAEMTVNFGLVCQNVSAASQAITTYIRTHMQRCEVQQDLPLLLRHVLSGTSSDDDLLPALHSRSGGAHCTTNVDDRATNFRRGTMVWYLSRATGAPCPFARVGIRLCDYGENGKVGQQTGTKEKKRQRDRMRRAEQQHSCGQKRKRPLRGCVATTGSDSDDVAEPPPKVKLTLRLKPLASSRSPSRQVDDSDTDYTSDDSMSVDSDESQEKKDEEEPWSLPPYPRRSISIPCYTPSVEGPYPCFPSPSYIAFRRSPSIPCSVGSLPPDSEDEDEDFHITMTRRNEVLETELEWDVDFDSEGDGETMWESPGPRSPSVSIMHSTAEIAVKEEPRDVQGMLEAWEDFDSNLADAKVIAQAAATVIDPELAGGVKIESIDLWDWDTSRGLATSEWGILPSEIVVPVKQEDFSLFPANHLLSTSMPLSPMSSLSSQLSAFSHSDLSSPRWGVASIGPLEFDDEVSDAWQKTRERISVAPMHDCESSSPIPSATLSTSLSHNDSPTSKTNFYAPETAALEGQSHVHAVASGLQTTSLITSGVSPSSLVLLPPCMPSEGTHGKSSSSDVVVVHTCQPCTPAISATQIEDISVYQVMLGPFLLLRRIDTDFVNLSPIVAYLGAPYTALNGLLNATAIVRGSQTVSGTWAPLLVAQKFIQEHPVSGGMLDVFLSDKLFERFPSALQDFHRSNAPGRMLNQFGRHFTSTLQATQMSAQSDVLVAAQMQLQQTWDSKFGWVQKEAAVLSANSVFSLSAALSADRQVEDHEAPLSATEQELFHQLCVMPEWEQESTNSPASDMEVQEQEGSSPPSLQEENDDASENTNSVQLEENRRTIAVASENSPREDRPLRRSKRVADAMAAQIQPRTSSRRRGSRNSLS